MHHLPTTLAAPAADPEMATCAGGAGDHGYSYTVTSQEDIAGDSLVGNYSVASASGGKTPIPFHSHQLLLTLLLPRVFLLLTFS